VPLSKNFFKLYNDFVYHSEPPPNFHAWSAIAAIGALLGKKCFIPQGHFTVFPNLYIVLVGDAGSRKTTAMDVAANLVRLADKVPLAPDSATRESLIDDMATNKVEATVDGRDFSYWQSAAFVSELHEFLGGKHINHQMVMFLTAIWDRPEYKERTRKGGEVRIRNPFFSLLGCCTPTWMTENLKQNVISDGFARRTIFVLEHDVARLIPRPKLRPEEQNLLVDLETEVKRIFALNGLFSFTTEAGILFDESYPTFREQGKKYSDKVKTYFSSKHILVLKIAMCISAATRDDKVVDSVVLQMALDFLTESEKALDFVFAGIGRNELKPYADRLYDHIAKAGSEGLNLSGVMKYAYDDTNAAEIEQMLTVLISQGRLKTLDPVAGDVGLRYAALKVRKLEPGRNLLEAASHIKPSLTEKIEALESDAGARQVAPMLERLATRQPPREVAQRKGILFQGNLRELLEEV
jgi:hypothetical protein